MTENMQPRNTKQKQIVTEIIEKSEYPLTVQEILEEGQKLLPNLGIATIYREIGRLSKADEVNVVSIIGDSPRYEAKKPHHHHFKCENCNKVYELEGCLHDIKNLVPAGFKAKTHDITFYGLCRSC